MTPRDGDVILFDWADRWSRTTLDDYWHHFLCCYLPGDSRNLGLWASDIIDARGAEAGQ